MLHLVSDAVALVQIVKGCAIILRQFWTGNFFDTGNDQPCSSVVFVVLAAGSRASPHLVVKDWPRRRPALVSRVDNRAIQMHIDAVTQDGA